MSVEATRAFNQTERIVEGWYWAFRSSEVAKSQVRPLKLAGRELAVYRDSNGRVHALDAYCPHMGAHLAEGKVDGEGLRCFFHGWMFAADGECADVPCAKGPVRASVASWPVEEKYGLIWVYTGATARHPIPFVPELENDDVDAFLGVPFEKGCHPNVVMINAIDAHHFNTVHHLPVELDFDCVAVNDANMTFSNQTKLPDGNPLTRLASRLYAGPLTYSMSYWFGSTGSVTVGPDLLHFHIIFALRPTRDGKAEGQTILVTKKRSGMPGFWFNRIVLGLSWAVGAYFARGDTRVFQTIRFEFKTPLRADKSIVQFIKHVEKQRTVEWGTWKADELVELPSLSRFEQVAQ